VPKISIDQREVEVKPGVTILAAARSAGVHIPALCYRELCRPNVSCMVCVVRVNGQNRFVPACATPVEEGMKVESDSPEVHAARKGALELLLSDHRGECVAPCQSGCAAHLDIQLMFSLLAQGKLEDAARTARKRLVLPAVLGHICPAPCQKACRRASVDRPLAIRDLHGLLAQAFPASPNSAGASGLQSGSQEAIAGKHVAIAGAGPAGLAAAYQLQRKGIPCTLFDKQPQTGGGLRYGVAEEQLPRPVLEAELAAIVSLGMELRLEVCLGEKLSLADLRSQFDAVLLALGETPAETLAAWGLTAGPKGLVVEPHTFKTNIPGVFAAGGILGPRKLAVRSIGEGNLAAAAIMEYLGAPPKEHEEPPPFYTVRAGNLKPAAPAAPVSFPAPPFSSTAQLPDVEAEAKLCLQCGCRKPEACRLRHYAWKYGAHTNRYPGSPRPLQPAIEDSGYIFDEGKCIVCGLCLQLAEAAQAPVGLAFSGRGFPLKVAIPFNATLRQSLGKAARACAEICPTNALCRLTPEDQED